MKFLIIGSKSDPASRNILMNLMDIGNFKYYIIEGDMLRTENFNMEEIKKYDLAIFCSKHKSEKKMKTLSVHAPGNFREVWGGGLSGILAPASALFQKHLFQCLNLETKKSQLDKKYSVTLEATHHGPLLEIPSVFIEVGGGPDEWRDKNASFVIAKAIRRAVETYKENPYQEIAFGIGGGHYCPSFNRLERESNVAIAHVIPKYVAPITEEMILEAFNKTIEEVDFAVLDWKGLGKSEERKKILEILDKNYIPYKKVSECK